MRVLLATALLCAASAASAQETPPAQPPPPVQPSWTYQRGRIEKDGLVTIFYEVGRGKGQLLQPYLQKFMTPKGSLLVSPPQPPNQPEIHVMMITDTKENIELIEKVLNILDKPAEQVQIEAQIIEKSIDSDFEIGAEFGINQEEKHSHNEFFKHGAATFNPDSFLNSLKPGAEQFQGVDLSFFNENIQSGLLNLKVRAMVKNGKATVLSSPYITVNNGETATIIAGDEVPYLESIIITNNVPTATVKFKLAAVKLIVTPQVVGQSFIDIDVKPEVTSVTGNVSIQGTETPVFSTRTADTHVTVRDGQQIVIGGLVRTSDVETRRGVPILTDIPIIGYLFGSTNLEKKKTEILFIMRPRIRKPEAVEELLAPGGGK
ncbi:MAG: type II and III secretion system protein [Planctomycetes bacterium]|nr:type II and III secretion system protein [Planctomycetota bacterium]